MKKNFFKKIPFILAFALLMITCIGYTPVKASAAVNSNHSIKVRLKSWKGDYLHRPDTAQGVTTWNSGKGNEWTLEFLGGDKVKLKSWKGDYLHRPDSEQGVTTWNSGKGNEWTLEMLNGKMKLKSWKGDYLHRPDSEQGVTTWNSGVGNEWTLELAN